MYRKSHRKSTRGLLTTGAAARATGAEAASAESLVISTATLSHALGLTLPSHLPQAVRRRALACIEQRLEGLGWLVLRHGVEQPVLLREREPLRQLAAILERGGGAARLLVGLIDRIHAGLRPPADTDSAA